ncbi:hypothetical protein [Phocaeicola plebeius]|uniref:hypothetical protein n=1 Tax=Phocaeicola plebeius TaxID=310297 RepID=UPI0035662391
MKQILLYLGVVLAIMGFHSCSNDFEEISANDNEAMSRASKTTGLNSNLASLFKGGAPTLSSSQIQEVNNAYSKMTSINCYNGIDKAIRNKTSYSGTIFIDDTQGAAYFHRGSLAFPSYSILASSMEHEFIHMYQRDVQGKQIDTSNEKRDTGMMEFELAFYQGVIRYIHAGNSWIHKGEDGDPSYLSLWTSALTDPSLIPEYERKFQTYVASICAKGVPTSININDFIEWSKIFGKYSRGYSGRGLIFGNYDYGTTCINSLLKLY